MKRNMLVAAGIALVLAFSLNHSKAQTTAPPPGAAGPPQTSLAPISADNPNPPPAAFQGGTNRPHMQRLPPPRLRQGRRVYSQTVMDLRAVKMELQRAQGDLGGHKDAAIEACDKAIQELAAVMKALPPAPPPQGPLQRPPGAMPPPMAPQLAPPATPAAPAAPPALPPQ